MISAFFEFMFNKQRPTSKSVVAICCLFFLVPFNVFSIDPTLPDSIPLGEPLTKPAEIVREEIKFADDSAQVISSDTIMVDEGPIATAQKILPGSKWNQEWVPRHIEFNPDPTRAVWMAALFPGLGQVYNRRYWKLPIIVGGYLGLAYGTSWNSTMLTDYTKAYSDLIDNDPTTNSYMNFFPNTTKEEDIDKNWLTSTVRSQRNYFRRNRDLCIICMVGVYLLAMVDAYVDASLAHFDISPDLSMNVAPAIFQDSRGQKPAIGMLWALNF
ncbi:MAG: hypothetical protein HDR74_05585 [Bacteroides sp.]|nr:hypothetical protein [Bacteroides sp.]